MKNFNFFRLPPEETRLMSLRWRGGVTAAVFASGALMAAALPPLNLGFAAFFALAPLTAAAWDSTPRRAAFLGWVWGLGWAIFAFRFLREIHPSIPWILAGILALWPAAWAGTIPFLRKNLLYPVALQLAGRDAMRRTKIPAWRAGLPVLALAALWTVLEYLRAQLFPWNLTPAALWKYPGMLGLLTVTGAWGWSFLIVLVNVALAIGWKLRTLRIPAAAAAAAILAALIGYPGPTRPADTVSIRIGAVQGDLSQRREPRPGQALEALDAYLEGTLRLAASIPRPELIVWPETAVPVPYFAAGAFAAHFRARVENFLETEKIPLLIGALDFETRFPGETRVPGLTNSALYFRAAGAAPEKYDKFYRVPYGEFIPLREFLPDFINRRIDLGRDLVPGVSLRPIELKPDVRAGVAICYESVFAAHARQRAREGANLLITLSNDAWYPESSEPEQHLANALLRTLETGLPQLRVGNNGGTLLLTPRGRIVETLTVPGTGAPELRRGRGTAVFTISAARTPAPTPYVRYGDWFVAASALLLAGVFWKAAGVWLRRKSELREKIEKKCEKIEKTACEKKLQ